MKIKCDNGNTVSRHMFMPYRNTESWSRVKKTPETAVENLQYQRNSDNLQSDTRNAIAEERSVCDAVEIITERGHDTTNLNVDTEVCNTQYRVSAQNNINILKSCSDKESCDVEGGTQTFINYSESYIRDRNVSPNPTPVDEEKIFDQPGTEEMFKNHPRGIVNPNYPGFQHLAHTLLDYSSNIENYYHSENDMTDDDVDLEITESSYEQEPMESEIVVGTKNVNNNEDTYLNDNDLINSILNNSQYCGLTKKNSSACDSSQNEIPDLLRTVSKNNNNVTIDYDLDADIENNFGTRDIIGDFNKEVEDEIKHLLNYNINIQDDLKELRQDIKETFARPIENTINNISEVVNHVIKKLVETHTDQETEARIVDGPLKTKKENVATVSENVKSEMNLCRPTFLLLEKDMNDKITDAILSDGKDEIKIAYNAENLSINVENTIKQLSTELRKIIPKLDQMRENEKLWSKNKNTDRIFTDGNCNEIVDTRNSYLNDASYTRCRADISNELKYNDPGIDSKDLDVPKMDRNTCDTEHPIVDQDDKNSIKICSENDFKKTSVLENCCPEDYNIGSFDVYNIETALPKLDLDAIENHLKAAKEAERRKRNDREEIRKRLAMGADSEEYYSMGYSDRPGKKPSLHSRLQTGKNLQICFMNEIASDNESQASDIEKNIDISTKPLSRSNIFSKSNYSLNNHPYQTRPLSVNISKHDKISCMQSGAKLRPSTLTSKSKSRSSQSLGHIEVKESDFYALQATLQTEARIALAQAKEMARLQMEASRRCRRGASPVREMVQRGMRAAGAPLAPQRRRVSRQLLTDLNVAQLQVIVNELHSQIEALNESLVKMLMSRDELHMGQDSMLVDIEDLTRYLGVKEQTKKTKGAKSLRRLTSAQH